MGDVVYVRAKTSGWNGRTVGEICACKLKPGRSIEYFPSGDIKLKNGAKDFLILYETGSRDGSPKLCYTDPDWEVLLDLTLYCNRVGVEPTPNIIEMLAP